MAFITLSNKNFVAAQMKQVLSSCTVGSTPVLSEAQLHAAGPSGPDLAKQISQPNASSIALSP